MPPKPTSARVTSYKALPPPKVQRKFNARQRHVRPRPINRKLLKCQPTLTQFDFESSLPSASAEAISCTSEDDSEEERPRKKRRKSKFDEKERGQKTLTQIENLRPSETLSLCNLDSQGWQLCEDLQPDGVIEVACQNTDDEITKAQWMKSEPISKENLQPPFETSDTSRISTSPFQAAHSRFESNHDVAKDRFQTPRKVRFTEVPSSQTPPDTEASTQSSARNFDTRRSPLEDRSIKTLPGEVRLRSQESQPATMKMLERIRAAARDVQSGRHQDPGFSITNDFPDDKDIYLDEESCRSLNFLETRTRNFSDSRLQRNLITERSLPQLKRTAPVQDSQDGDLASDTQSDCTLRHEQHEFGGDELDEYQPTYDPANEALDRDAARFGRSQTQKVAEFSRTVVDDSETDDDDLDHGCDLSGCDPPLEGMHRETTPSVPHPPSAGLRSDAEIFAQPGFTKPTIAASYQKGVSKAEVGDRTDASLVRSSPSQPRQSQISTIVPTQDSLKQPSNQTLTFSDTPNLSFGTPKRQSQSSVTQSITPGGRTQKSATLWQPLFMSSSPLTFPPWTSPERSRFFAADSPSMKSHDSQPGQLNGLLDFSLPPPPPLSSSVRHTPSPSDN